MIRMNLNTQAGRSLAALAVATLFLTGACKPAPRPAASTERIVTLSGGVTEIVYALGNYGSGRFIASADAGSPSVSDTDPFSPAQPRSVSSGSWPASETR